MGTPLIMITFSLFLCLFLGIGIASAIKKKNTVSDYLLANQGVSDWVAALSAVASSNSGYMFIGMIGYTYSVGISSMWAMIGWIVGDFLMSFLIYSKIIQKTARTNSLSFSELLGKWQDKEFKQFRKVAGLIIVLFLGVYAAAQLNAGSKALFVMLGLPDYMGAIIGAVIVIIYCFSGGMRASLWTDVAQSIVMFMAMGLLCVLAVMSIGGLDMFVVKLQGVSTTYTNLFPPGLKWGALGPFLFGMGWFFAGLAVIGQPHIMSRFMTLRPDSKMWKVRLYYYSWYVSFSILTVMVGLCARLLLPELGSFDAELALPLLALDLFPAVLVGLILAGIFSAAISTADSQIISCIASLSRDVLGFKDKALKQTKALTLLLTAFILVIALFAPGNVFSLVIVAWSGLASAFAPMLILLVFKRPISERLAILMSLSGLVVVVMWRLFGLEYYVVDVLPGMLMGFLVYGLASVLGPSKGIDSFS